MIKTLLERCEKLTKGYINEDMKISVRVRENERACVRVRRSERACERVRRSEVGACVREWVCV